MRFKPCLSYLLISALLLAVSTCARPRTSTDGPRNRGEPFILVSALGASAVFPAESMRHWGWDAAIPMTASAPHVWEARVDGVDGTWVMRWQVRRVQSAKPAHSSLAALLEHGEGSLCRLEYGPVCEPVAVGAIARGERVSLGIADSAAVVRMFGDRPRWATFVREQPGFGSAQVIDSVPIEYTDPDITGPGQVLRDRALQRRRRVLAAATSVERRITAGPAHHGPLWIAVGDTVMVTALETRCRETRCLEPVVLGSDSAWHSDDVGVAKLGAAPGHGATGHAVLVGVAKGRTTIRLDGLRAEVDTSFDGTVAASEVEREVIVADPVSRLWISPRPDTVVIDQPIRLRVMGEVYGDGVEAIPAGVIIARGTSRERLPGTRPAEFSFDTPGRHTIIAYAGVHAETLAVTVLSKRPMLRVSEYAPDLPHVLVSADEARFIFRRVPPPPPQGAGWGWGPWERGRYSWIVWVDAFGEERHIQVGAPYVEGPAWETGHTFPSLKDLVAYMKVTDCNRMEWMLCTTRGLDAWVEDGRVVLSLRDRATIERYFRLRPNMLELDESFPGDTNPMMEPVPVVYVDPQLPLPDPEFLSYAERERTEFLSIEARISRALVATGRSGERIQLAVGDTVELGAGETISLESRNIGGGPLSVDRWVVQDTNVVFIIETDTAARVADRRASPGPRVRLVARAPGTTVVRAAGLRGAGDTVLTRHAPVDEVSRPVLVTPRYVRVTLAPRPEEVLVGDTVRFELQALNAAGARVPGVPGSLVLWLGNAGRSSEGVTSHRFRFEQPGTYRLVGKIGSMADTVIIVARDR